MQSAFVTQCPSCGAKLKLKDQNAGGKKIRCPKCAKVFAAAALGADKPAARDFDEYGSLGDETASADPFEQSKHSQPLPARVRSARPSSKASRPHAKSSTEESPVTTPKAAKKGPNLAVLLIAGGLSFAVMFVIMFFVSSSMFSGRGLLARFGRHAAEGIPVKYLPADPEVVICIRVADILATPAGKAALDDPEFKKPVEMFAKAIGLQPEDVDTVTLAIATTAAMRGPRSGAMISQLRAVSGEDAKSQTRCVVIVRTKKPIDKKAFADTFKIGGSPIGTGATHFSGFRVFRKRETSAAAFPDATTMLLGSVLTIDEILANPSPSIPELQAIDPKQHVVLAVLPTYWPKSENLLRLRDDGPTGMRIRAAAGFLYGDYNIAAVGLTFGQNVRVRLKCVCSSDGSAKDLQKAIAEDIDSSGESGVDEPELPVGRAKGANKQKPKTHLNPLVNPALYDFRAAGRDKTTSLKWTADPDPATIEFSATLKGQDAQEQASQLLSRLTFYQPNEEKQ
jgi:predicted Zn finger-like uncharacterized protein